MSFIDYTYKMIRRYIQRATGSMLTAMDTMKTGHRCHRHGYVGHAHGMVREQTKLAEAKMNLILSQRAFDSIQQECSRYALLETGGILPGKFHGRDILVPFIIGSGPQARRSFTRFEPDYEWQQKQLDECFERYGLNYVGSFHRHFGSLSRPSHIDHETALQILSDPDWNVSKAVFPIIILEGDTVVIYPYQITRKVPEFRTMAIWIVPDDDPCMAASVQKTGLEDSEAKSNHNGRACQKDRRDTQRKQIKKHFVRSLLA